MSILYNFSVREAKKVKISVPEIINFCFDSMEDNFRKVLTDYRVDVSLEPKKKQKDLQN